MSPMGPAITFVRIASTREQLMKILSKTVRNTKILLNMELSLLDMRTGMASELPANPKQATAI